MLRSICCYLNCHSTAIHTAPLFSSAVKFDIRCVAITHNDSNCTSTWALHTGEFSTAARKQSSVSTLTECQIACEFDPRCVAADWLSTDRYCWITTNPDYQHYRPTDIYSGWLQNGSHYHLDSRCNITTGQCLHELLSC